MGEAVDRIVRVPAVIARRAWECAEDLRQRDDLSGRERFVVAVVVRQGPERITWYGARAMFVLHRRHFARRAA